MAAELTTALTVAGLVALLASTLRGLPQLALAVREGHVEGLALGTLWLWLTGEACFLFRTIVLYPDDWFLLLNYGANLAVLTCLVKYKHWPRE